jgi:hypothetical protein
MNRRVTTSIEQIEFSEGPYRGLEFCMGRLIVQTGERNHFSLDSAECSELYKKMQEYYEN